MSAFVQVGVAYVDPSWKRLKLVINGNEYFVRVKDLHYALSKSRCFSVSKKFSVSVFKHRERSHAATMERNTVVQGSGGG